MLDEHGMSDVIDGLRELSEMGRLEFVGSAKYHPILPLVPQEEMLRQIMQNYQTNRRYFGKAYSPMGFFSPEMCYSREISKPIIRWEDSPQLGYEILPNKYFYRYQPPTPAKELLAEFWRLEREAEIS